MVERAGSGFFRGAEADRDQAVLTFEDFSLEILGA
jgi:hypothetical protein